MADEDFMNWPFENNDLALKETDPSLDLSEFLNLDAGTGLVEQSETTETHLPLDYQTLRSPQNVPDVPDDFRRREIELRLEETELQLKRNKLELELLALRRPETASVASNTSISSVPGSGMLHQRHGPSVITAQWSEVSHVSNSRGTAPSDMSSAIDWDISRPIYPDTDPNLHITKLTGQDEHTLVPWSENTNLHISPSESQISKANSYDLSPKHHDRDLTFPNGLS